MDSSCISIFIYYSSISSRLKLHQSFLRALTKASNFLQAPITPSIAESPISSSPSLNSRIIPKSISPCSCVSHFKAFHHTLCVHELTFAPLSHSTFLSNLFQTNLFQSSCEQYLRSSLNFHIPNNALKELDQLPDYQQYTHTFPKTMLSSGAHSFLLEYTPGNNNWLHLIRYEVQIRVA